MQPESDERDDQRRIRDRQPVTNLAAFGPELVPFLVAVKHRRGAGGHEEDAQGEQDFQESTVHFHPFGHSDGPGPRTRDVMIVYQAARRGNQTARIARGNVADPKTSPRLQSVRFSIRLMSRDSVWSFESASIVDM